MPLPYNRSLVIVVGAKLNSWRYHDDASSGQMVRKYYDRFKRLRCVEYPDTQQWDLFHYRLDGQLLSWEDARSNWKLYRYDPAGEQLGYVNNGDWWELTDHDNKVYYCETLQLYSCPHSGFEGSFQALLTFLGLGMVVNQLSACTGGPDDPVVLTDEEQALGLKRWRAFFSVRRYLRSLLGGAGISPIV